MAGNIGEWSEVYTFFKLLADGKLYCADKDLNKINELYYIILQIIRNDTNPNNNIEDIHIYSRNSSNGEIDISAKNKSFSDFSVSINDFKTYSNEIYHNLINKNVSVLPTAKLNKFKNTVHCYKLKAPSNSKSDITVKVHDMYTGCDPIFDFSIKSKIGSASTLLNASGATNFIYEIKENISDSEIDYVNNLDRFSKKINYLYTKNISFNYCDIENPIFFNNLFLIDTSMPEIIANMLLEFYSGNANDTNKLVDIIKNKNICKINSGLINIFYEYKMKDFLQAVALGMKPATQWNGNFEATGGYIIVKEDGEILCYHIYNRNDLRDYLYNYTRFETPSTGKHGFGKIYKENSKLYIKLNLQIRFKK